MRAKTNPVLQYITQYASYLTVLRNTAQLYFAEVINQMTMFFITIMMSRSLDPSEYGLFAFAFAFVSMFSIISDMGISTMIIRKIAQFPRKLKSIFWSSFFLKGLLSFIALSVIYFAYTAYSQNQSDIIVVLFISSYVILYSFIKYYFSLFRAKELMHYEVIVKVVFSLSLLAACYYVFTNSLSLIDYLYSYLGAILVGFLLGTYFVFVHILNLRIEVPKLQMKQVLVQSFPYSISYFFVNIYFWIDSVMIEYFHGTSDVATYSVAYKIVFALSLIPFFFMNAIYPRLSKHYKFSTQSFHKYIQFALRYITLISLAVFPTLFLLAEIIIVLLYTDVYIQSVMVFKIILWAQLFAFYSYIFMYVFNSMDKPLYYTYTVGFCLMLNIVLNLLLIPTWSYIGASIATVSTEFVALIILAIIYKIKCTKK